MCLGIPGKVIETYVENDVRMGKIDFGGVTRRACLEAVPHARVDDYVIIHVGYALSRLDEREARRVFDFLKEMNELAELSEQEAPVEVP